MLRLSRLSLVSALFVSVIGRAASAQFSVNPTFDVSILTNPNSAAIKATINRAVGVYSHLFSDPFQANILFRFATTAVDGSPLPGNVLGESNTSLYGADWNTYIGQLVGDASSANDAKAVASLPGGPLANDIIFSAADGRAVGFDSPGFLNADGSFGGNFDGIITLNSSFGNFWNFDRAGGIGPNQFDGVRVFQHEVDEILGTGSWLPNTFAFPRRTAWMPEDLFRFSAPGVRSHSINAPSSYFSIDGGATNITGFNQILGGDFGDWLSPTSCPTQGPELVQFAFSCPGGIANVSRNSPEGIALDVVGYDQAPVTTPEPATTMLLATGLVGLAAFGRRKLQR